MTLLAVREAQFDGRAVDLGFLSPPGTALARIAEGPANLPSASTSPPLLRNDGWDGPPRRHHHPRSVLVFVVVAGPPA